MSRGCAELLHCIESGLWPQSFRNASCKNVATDVGYNCENSAFGGAVSGRPVLGKPWFTRHNQIVDWRRQRLRMTVYGKSLEIDASMDRQCHPSHYQNLSDAVEKGD
jgi:hypothetical protein